MNPDSSQSVADTLTPRASPRYRLASLPDVRIEMAKLYRQMKSGKIRTQDGTRLAYVLSQVGKLIESSDLQTRLEALEAKLRNNNLGSTP